MIEEPPCVWCGAKREDHDYWDEFTCSSYQPNIGYTVDKGVLPQPFKLPEGITVEQFAAELNAQPEREITLMISDPGTWWLKSKSDPRWNAVGQGMVGGLVRPEALERKLSELTQQLGPPPADLEWGYMKD